MDMILTLKCNFAGRVLEQQVTPTAAGKDQYIDETIPDSSTDKQLNWTCDVSQIKGCYMLSDKEITLESNDGSTPDDTLILKAGVPYIYHDDDYNGFKFGTDVVKLYITNASGAAARIQIASLEDPTP